MGVPLVPVPGVFVGPKPCVVKCPYCHEDIVTTVKNKASASTHVAALIMCCFLCWCCAFLPYVMDSCMNQEHYCPNCQAYLATYHSR